MAAIASQSTWPGRLATAAELYQPLEARQSRVLQFLFTYPNDLTAALHTTSLDRPVKYMALSYTWQPNSLPKTSPTSKPPSILLDGVVVQIQPNLYRCLSHMLDSIVTECLYVFIDALCINQVDDIERATQVQLMTSIYRQAHCVWAWIGVPRSALEASLAGEMLELRREMAEDQELLHKTPSDADLAPLPGTINHLRWLAVLDLFREEY